MVTTLLDLCSNKEIVFSSLIGDLHTWSNFPSRTVYLNHYFCLSFLPIYDLLRESSIPGSPTMAVGFPH